MAKRKESRFVALYAVQAGLMQAFFSVGAIGLGAVELLLYTVSGLSPHQAIAFTAIPLGAAIAGLLLLCVHAFAAYSASQGKALTLPVAGRIAQGILRADRGAAKSWTFARVDRLFGSAFVRTSAN